MDLHIKTKFEVGQDVYHIESSRKVVECEKTCELCFGAGSFIYKTSCSETCELCFGAGSFIYKDYKCNCPKCGGHGKIIVDRKNVQINSVDGIQWKITSIKVTVDKDENIILRYTIIPHKHIKQDSYSYGYSKTTAFEEELFATLEEAQSYCDEQNRIQMKD